MSGTGAPKGNQYRRGKKASETGFTIGLYVSAHEASIYRRLLTLQNGVEPTQGEINACAREAYKQGAKQVEERINEIFQSRKISSEKP